MKTMKATLLILPVFLLATLLLGCDKDEPNIADGTYTGTFTVKYSSSSETQTGQTTLELKDGRFSCSGNANRIPAGGSGTFSMGNNNVTLSDENIWTANFDSGLVLDGEYDYSFDGNQLKISADRSGFARYEYNLEKQ